MLSVALGSSVFLALDTFFAPHGPFSFPFCACSGYANIEDKHHDNDCLHFDSSRSDPAVR